MGQSLVHLYLLALLRADYVRRRGIPQEESRRRVPTMGNYHSGVPSTFQHVEAAGALLFDAEGAAKKEYSKFFALVPDSAV